MFFLSWKRHTKQIKYKIIFGQIKQQISLNSRAVENFVYFSYTESASIESTFTSISRYTVCFCSLVRVIVRDLQLDVDSKPLRTSDLTPGFETSPYKLYLYMYQLNIIHMYSISICINFFHHYIIHISISSLHIYYLHKNIYVNNLAARFCGNAVKLNLNIIFEVAAMQFL